LENFLEGFPGVEVNPVCRLQAKASTYYEQNNKFRENGVIKKIAQNKMHRFKFC